MTQNKRDKRRDKIFDLIVKSYIETAEPVGSRTISRHSDLCLSPASIRNVMADLEDDGLLKHPHTSAGRVPTDKGYRYFVDQLMEPEELTKTEKDLVRTELGKEKTIEGLAEKVSKVISKLTENAALIYVKNLKRVSFLNYLLEELIEAEKLASFLEEDSELFVEGAFRIFEQPEFHNLEKMGLLLQALDEKYEFLQVFVNDLNHEGVHVHIGQENPIGELDDVSLVVKDYYFSGTPIGSIAVIGPTRMRYPKVMSVVDYVADSVTETIERF